jgi:hypothetical protein
MVVKDMQLLLLEDLADVPIQAKKKGGHSVVG